MQNVTLSQLRGFSNERLVELHDELVRNVVFMPKDCLDELNRRSQEAETKAMRQYTLWITVMTAVITVATIANLGVAFVLLRKS